MRIKNVLLLNNPFALSDINIDYPSNRQLDIICNKKQNDFLIHCPRTNLSRFKVLQKKQNFFLDISNLH